MEIQDKLLPLIKQKLICILITTGIYTPYVGTKDLKLLPLMVEGKTDTNGHVVDTQGDRITFLGSVL